MNLKLLLPIIEKKYNDLFIIENQKEDYLSLLGSNLLIDESYQLNFKKEFLDDKKKENINIEDLKIKTNIKNIPYENNNNMKDSLDDIVTIINKQENTFISNIIKKSLILNRKIIIKPYKKGLQWLYSKML